MEDASQGSRRARPGSSSSKETRMTPTSSNSSSAHLPRANAELGMCEKCAELDRKIEHDERISFLIGDQLTVGRIKELVAKMKSEKAELHPFPADKSH